MSFAVLIFHSHEIFQSLLVRQQLGHFEELVLVGELLLQRVLEPEDVVIFVVVQVDLPSKVFAEVGL
jgi:hypothetical protein